MKFVVYDHCGGTSKVAAKRKKEIEDAIAAISIEPAKRAASKMREQFLASLKGAGWSGEYAVSKGSNIKITSLRDDIGFCLQTGNMARMYADMMKLQTLYLDGSIRSAVIVLPSDPVAKKLGQNIASAKRLERELAIFQKAYHVPTLVYALE